MFNSISVQAPEFTRPAQVTPSDARQKPVAESDEKPMDEKAIEKSDEDLRMIETVRSVIEDVFQKLNSNSHALEFSVEKLSGSLVIKVVNEISKEVIREIRLENLFGSAGSNDDLRGYFVVQKA